MKAFLPGLFLLCLSACGTVQPSPPALASENEKTPVGEVKFASQRRPANLCPLPDKMSGCRILKSGKLTITAAGGSGSLGESYYAVSVNDGKEGGFVDTLDWILLQGEGEHKQAVAAAADCDRRGGVSVGMTKKQVLASCWGKPKRVNSMTTARGTREQWVYGLRSYLYFNEEGVLTTIQN